MAVLGFQPALLTERPGRPLALLDSLIMIIIKV